MVGALSRCGFRKTVNGSSTGCNTGVEKFLVLLDLLLQHVGCVLSMTGFLLDDDVVAWAIRAVRPYLGILASY